MLAGTSKHVPYRMPHQPQRGRRPGLSPAFLAVLYGLLLAYGTLYPLSGWEPPLTSPWMLVLAAATQPLSRSDILTNFVVYLPFGFLLAQVWGRRTGWAAAILISTLVGALVSVTLEYLQAYLPNRVPSLLDIGLNTLGSLTGALIAAGLRADGAIGCRLQTLRNEYVEPGALGLLGGFVALLWALSQLSPLVPSLDVGNLRDGLKLLWHTLNGRSPFEVVKATLYALQVTGLGVVASTALQSTQHRSWLFAGFVLAILSLKVPVVGQQLSLEALAGAGLGLLVTHRLNGASPGLRHSVGALALLSAVGLAALRPGAGTLLETTAFNWIPFRLHLANSVIGLMDLTAGIWPFVALAYLALRSEPRSLPLSSVSGALGVFGFVFVLEWCQRALPGRSPDITDALIALAAWTIPWLHPKLRP
ncbi:MAG: VanZ family protein [Gammaproteobacteria bacterium]